MTGSFEGKVTLGSQRSVLSVVRNGASAFRMLEIIRLFDDDERLNLRMTVGPQSRYDYGVEQLLTSERIRLLPWNAAKESRFDLILSGSAHTCLSQLRGPVVLFPHGAGHHKRPPALSDGDQVFELTDDQLMHDGTAIATRHLLPGPDSLTRLERDCAPAARRAVIAGDPIVQQLRAHLSLRDSYRAELGLRPGQKLVVVSSTWGPRSLAGQSLGVLRRLVAELPMDEYRVAATFHHNVTIRDGHRELERILRSTIDSGLILIPPESGWQSTVLASDCLIGDYGSTTFYASDVVPVAIAAHAPDECPADSPMTALANAVPHIDPDRPLRPQIDSLTDAPRPSIVEEIIDSSVTRDIDAPAVFRSTMYELMGLAEPTAPAALPVAAPRSHHREVTAFVVQPAVDGAVVRLRRYPAATAPMRDGGHLVVRTDDPDPRRPQSAAALVATKPGFDLAALLDRFPGCRVAVKPVPDAIAFRVRAGSEFTIGTDAVADAEAATLAVSGYLGFEVTGRTLPDRFTVTCGGRRIVLHRNESALG